MNHFHDMMLLGLIALVSIAYLTLVAYLIPY